MKEKEKSRYWGMGQADFIAFAETLEADITALETGLRSVGKDVPPRPEVPRHTFTLPGREPQTSVDYIEHAELLEAHRAKLKMICSIGGVKVQLAPAKPQIQNHMSTDTKTGSDSRKLTATEKCLAAKGLTMQDLQPAKLEIVLKGSSAKALAARHAKEPTEKD